jgi:hypothetical protein
MSSQFVNNEQLRLSIMEETEKINECITEWYNTNFPDDLDEFKGCCDEDEINVLIKCYKIFSENKNSQFLDYDIINALLMYYYVTVIFEDYVNQYIDEKYLKIVSEEKSKNPRNPNLYLLIDNNNNIYTYYWTKYDDEDPYPYIEIEDPVKDKEFYARNKGRETDRYIYQDENLTKKVKTEKHMNCLENMLTTKKSKEYYDLLSRGDAHWISQIRRLVLNMNTELFEGHKGGKNFTKKNKKYIKKSRKNKGKNNKIKKRINKIKYTKNKYKH